MFDKRTLCLPILLLSVTVNAVPAGRTSTTFRDTFTGENGAQFADRWETVGGTWQVRNGRLEASSPSRRAFAYVPDVPEASHVQIRARLRVTGRDATGSWALAGIAAYLGPTDFWELSLVEAPEGKRYVELVEMFRGTWQAQRVGDIPLRRTKDQGQWDGWQRNHDYDLCLTLSPKSVDGTVADPATGKTVTHIAYAWGKAHGVKSGRPGLLVNAFRMTVGDMTAQWSPPPPPPPGLTVQHGKLGAVAVLTDASAGIDGETVRDVTQALRTGGYGVTPLSCQQLVTGGVLDPRRFDALVLTDSPRFPVAGTGSLMRFLRGGGDLVLMGGLPFTTPLYRLGNRWLTADEVATRLSQTPVQQMLFDFENGSAKAWRRLSNHLDRPSKASIVAGPTGKALLLDIRGLEGWDTFGVHLPRGLAATSNVLCFRARASKGTPAMIVELREKDGSRWIAKVDMSASWKPYVLPPSRFEFWQAGSPKNRGGSGDSVHFAQVRYMSFGLADSHIPGISGDHRLWIDRIGTARADLPQAATGLLPRLNAFSNYQVYRMEDVRRAVPAPGGGPVTTTLTVNVPCRGWSAVGFAFPNESVFVPLLSAEDGLGRSEGWAAGALLNDRGEYRNSSWLLFGVETPAFYRDPGLLAELPRLLAQVSSPKLLTRLRRTERAERAGPYALRTPPPQAGFIRLSADGRHLVYPDGRRFFMVGCNYVGGFTRCGGREWSDDFFDARDVEDDFRKAHEAGLNMMRYWIQGPLDQDIRQGKLGKVHTICECARRYDIHLLLDLPGTSYPTEEAVLASHRAIAKAFRNEPMVIGYDIRNEPYVSTLGAIRYTGTPAPVQTVDLSADFPGMVDAAKVDAWMKQRPRWLHLPRWIQGAEARHVIAADVLWSRYLRAFHLDSSALTGLDGTVPVGRWKPLLDVVNGSLQQWLDMQVKAIRQVDPNHLITVGHNTALCILPANSVLDFVSKHSYIRPYSYDDVVENVTTLDRLKKLWPDRPITFGEFGYSNGIRMGDHYLDPYTSSVGEMIHFLYAFAHNYDGCTKWMLVDWPLAVMEHYGDKGGLDRAGHIYEARFGLYSYDGTRHGRPKPIVAALRFFRRLVDRAAPGGTMTITHDANPIGAGYVFRAKDALYVGGRQSPVPEVQFRCNRTTNVMLDWDAQSLRVMSTADVTVTVDVKAFASGLATRPLAATGTVTPPSVRQGRYTLTLEAGKTAVLE